MGSFDDCLILFIFYLAHVSISLPEELSRNPIKNYDPLPPFDATTDDSESFGDDLPVERSWLAGLLFDAIRNILPEPHVPRAINPDHDNQDFDADVAERENEYGPETE